ncbi:MAG: glutamine--fructose-6-phosphate transaminase (isomerizing) [Planktomarina sp.]
MCGIVGVLGNHEAAPLLVEALKRLEYRGYDSAGIATVEDGHLDRRRAVGKLVNLSDHLVHDPLTGKAGIGHTRWATHGEPSVRNAHPHRKKSAAVVHNGIVENYKELREGLIAQGFEFEGETDTEVVAALAQSYLSTGYTPQDAARETVAQLEGAFALAFLFEGEDDLMIAARKGSPLAIGHGVGEMFIGSDAIALAPMTDQITYLEEGDFAVLTRTSLEVEDKNGQRANRACTTVDIDAAQVDKGGHKHFMAKEIAQQPSVLNDTIKAYVKDGAIALPGPGIDFTAIDRLTITACGTAYYAGMVAKYWFEQIARLPVDIDIASELRYREPPVPPRTAALFISQSGETADTLAALRYMASQDAQIVGVVNVDQSSIARESDLVLPIHAGVEIGVASTKAFTCQLVVLLALALKAAQQRGTCPDISAHLDTLTRLPGLINQGLDIADAAQKISAKLAEARDILFLGRGPLFPLAMEGALKLKEISYIHAEGYAAGELKHGPIALIDKHVPVVVMAPRDDLFDKTISNMQEVMARGGKVVLISDAAGLAAAGDGVWKTLEMPSCDPLLAPLVYALPAQLLAYHTAVAKGTDVDQPRNLAKSVTVE